MRTKVRQIKYERDAAESEVIALQEACDKAVSKGEWVGAVARALVKNSEGQVVSPTSAYVSYGSSN